MGAAVNSIGRGLSLVPKLDLGNGRKRLQATSGSRYVLEVFGDGGPVAPSAGV